MIRFLLATGLLAVFASADAKPWHEVPVGESTEVAGFAFSKDKAFTGPLKLRRVEVYADDARILLVQPDGSQRELPRSTRRYFVADGAHTASRLYLSVNAEGTDFEGALFDADGNYSFAGRIVGDRLVRKSGAKQSAAEAGAFSCGSDHTHEGAGGPAPADLAIKDLPKRAKGATHTAVVAVDTDNEFFTQKFTDNAQGLTNATNYLAALFTGMNVFYERDLGVRLLQGTTLLRAPHASGVDPYVQSSTGNQLNEVVAVWRTTPELTAINRAFVMFLSGKSSSPNSSSGIAWLITSGNYCTAKGNASNFGHFSVSQVFRFAGSTAASDVRLVGHEIGHNFGAAHTHCSSRTNGASTVSTNTIDQCYNAETGCYSGPVSCPTDNSVSGRGSLMSYCNFSAPSGAACGQTLGEFHPAHQTLLAARITTNVNNSCLTPLGGGGGCGGSCIFRHGFENP